jgi:hypothetical protein
MKELISLSETRLSEITKNAYKKGFKHAMLVLQDLYNNQLEPSVEEVKEAGEEIFNSLDEG